MKDRIIVFFISIMILIQGCGKLEDFGDTNVNPGTTSSPVTAALLTSVLSNLGNIGYTGQGGFYCQYFSETSYPYTSIYGSNKQSPMSSYSSYLYDLQNIILTNSNDSTKIEALPYGANENQIAIARILKAYIFWSLTDTWGDIPYFGALKGNPKVSYDMQEFIYKDLIKELTEAIAQFKTGLPVKGDIAYNGDIVKWKKLANSLRMLMALNLSKRFQGVSDYAANQFKAALSDPAGSIETNTDNFQLIYPGGSIYKNPFNTVFLENRMGESATLVSLLIDTIGDPRQNVFGSDRNGNPSTLGVPYGYDRGYIDPWVQTHPNYTQVLAPAFRKETSPLFLIKAASILLARAEAADRGWTTENTSSLYKAGITASFTMWGLPEPDADYFTKSKVALGAQGTNRKQIAIQQYLAYYPDCRNGWNTWRRTGWPILSPAPQAVNFPKVIPRRMMYGQEDYSLVADSVEVAAKRLGPNGDKMDSRVWWDKD